MMRYQWPYLQRPDQCKCQACQALRTAIEQQNVIRAAQTWPRRDEPAPGTVILFGRAAS